MECGVVLILLKTFSHLLPCVPRIWKGRGEEEGQCLVSWDLSLALEVEAAFSFCEEGA